MKKGSGKQIISKLLADLSTKLTSDKELDLATQKLRAAFLLHGSTSDEMFEIVSRLIWASSVDADTNTVARQGIATKNGNIFISDIFEVILENSEIKDEILRKYDVLDSKDYNAVMTAIWLLITSVQMFTDLLPVEENGVIDMEKWLNNSIKHYNLHFS